MPTIIRLPVLPVVVAQLLPGQPPQLLHLAEVQVFRLPNLNERFQLGDQVLLLARVLRAHLSLLDLHPLQHRAELVELLIQHGQLTAMDRRPLGDFHLNLRASDLSPHRHRGTHQTVGRHILGPRHQGHPSGGSATLRSVTGLRWPAARDKFRGVRLPLPLVTEEHVRAIQSRKVRSTRVQRPTSCHLRYALRRPHEAEHLSLPHHSHVSDRVLPHRLHRVHRGAGVITRIHQRDTHHLSPRLIDMGYHHRRTPIHRWAAPGSGLLCRRGPGRRQLLSQMGA
mmetsp:Transcript_14017/g.34008  ORF Transcript_14017/g.34008 Transcript_14017/m.34008 type:complete len:282 (+) Transcript_14017:1477-2322(+)